MSDRMKQKMTGVYFTLVGITLIIIFVLALTVGRYKISVVVFFKMLFGSEGYEIERSVVLNLRLPRTIIAALTGTALSVSGLLYQETFQNRLVSPDLLGVSSGAGVGAALAIVIGASSVFVSFFAFVVGVFTVLATTFVAKSFKNKSSMALTLSGIIVGGFMGAVLSFIKYLADAETTLASITFWLMGSFEQSTMADVYVLLPIVIICSIVILSIGWRVNIVALGREEAQTKGINYRLYRAIIIIVATLLTASSVAFSGTIGWIGLVVPHIVRLTVGRDTKKAIPMCMLFGATFMIIADILSRVFTAAEVPLSAVTGFFGTIVFVVLLFIRRDSIREND